MEEVQEQRDTKINQNNLTHLHITSDRNNIQNNHKKLLET